MTTEPRPVRIHRTGSLQPGHQMTLTAMRDFINDVLAVHRSCSDVPEAVIQFPDGFWVTYATDEDEETITP